REIPTPVAAQTVFSAVSRYSERRQFMEWIVFLSLVCAIVVAIGIFYYFKVTPLTPETSSPMVAKGIEAGTDKTIAITLPEVAPVGEVSGGVPVLDAPESTKAMEQEVTAVTHPPAEVSLEPAEPAIETPPAGLATEADTATTTTAETAPVAEPAAVVEPEKPAPAEVATVLPGSLPEEITVEESAIAISRSKSVRQEDSLVQSAYAAYQAGDFASAQSQYTEVLKSDPENRDALLGLAALAYRSGNIQSAYEKYLEVIRYYPTDTTARAAIINLQSAADLQKSESLLKLMIQDDPGSAYLHFTLGNLFARQQRWPQAQQEFFDAFRLDSSNPDYAHNLAVSLDHLGQNRAAIDYYKKALELASLKDSRFERSSVSTRISMLEAVENGL
ncbi:MAG: tetratricopeptide repeat protein, partial [Gammaproteobacteria bacterium]|nr:tetratricopeptide repeat protein [Gammaproteobacteria bacterium]